MSWVYGEYYVIPVTGFAPPFTPICAPLVNKFESAWPEDYFIQNLPRVDVLSGEIDCIARFENSPDGDYPVFSIDSTKTLTVRKFTFSPWIYYELGYTENGTFNTFNKLLDHDTSIPEAQRVAKFGFYQCDVGGVVYTSFHAFTNDVVPDKYAWHIYRPQTEYQTVLALLAKRFVHSLDPYGTDDNQTPTGGYGPYDYSSEVETPPQLPSLSAAQVGFVSLWNPTQTEMQDLANYLWTGTFDLTNFKKLFTDPMECVLSVGLIPITPTREASKREIVFGGSSHSGVNAYAVTKQFYIVDMGTLHITGMSQGALDYSPYAKASIYLPYCGTYALDVDEIMDSDISLEYHIDIYTGACVAYLTIDGHLNSDGKNVNAIMYQFTGNVLASIPITGNEHSQFIQSMLFMGAAVAATVATSGASAGATAGAGPDLGAETAATGFNKALAGSAINTVMSMKPNVLHSGNLSTTAGMLGGQKPFITMTWSNLCRPEDEYKLVGMPLHKSGTLSDFSGFTIVSACHMDNILCTDAELQMIEQALAKGVII